MILNVGVLNCRDLAFRDFNIQDYVLLDCVFQAYDFSPFFSLMILGYLSSPRGKKITKIYFLFIHIPLSYFSSCLLVFLHTHGYFLSDSYDFCYFSFLSFIFKWECFHGRRAVAMVCFASVFLFKWLRKCILYF